MSTGECCECNCASQCCDWIQKQWNNPKVRVWTNLAIFILNAALLSTLYCLYCQNIGITFSVALFVPIIAVLATQCVLLLLDLLHEGKDPNFSTI